MKKISCFSIEKGGKVYPYIKINDDGNIIVGEEGRGRKLVTVPLPAGAEIDKVEEYSIVPVVKRINTSHDDTVVAVLIEDQSGYRGTWRLCRDLSDDELNPEEIGHVVAEGWVAEGAAGRMGGGPEYLILARPGEFIIHRKGRLYGNPEYIAVEIGGDGVVKCYDIVAAVNRIKAASSW